MQTPDELVGRNLAALRTERRLTVRGLSAAMGRLGLPMLPSVITKTEHGERRVSVNEMVALALVLNVPPTRLMLPVDDPDEQIWLVPCAPVTAKTAWRWAQAETSMTFGRLADLHDPETRDDEFVRESVPKWERTATAHQAVRRIWSLLRTVRAYLVSSDPSPPQSELVRELRRVVDEVEDLSDAMRAHNARPFYPAGQMLPEGEDSNAS